MEGLEQSNATLETHWVQLATYRRSEIKEVVLSDVVPKVLDDALRTSTQLLDPPQMEPEKAI